MQFIYPHPLPQNIIHTVVNNFTFLVSSFNIYYIIFMCAYIVHNHKTIIS